jgi:GMP synthase-like glutamine amidotransferase
MAHHLVIVNYKTANIVEDPRHIKCVDLLHKSNADLGALLDGVSILILSGGPQHVPDIGAYPELEKEIQLIFLAAQRGITVIGICLGFQLINFAFGNPVSTLPIPIIGCGKLDVSSVRTYADPVLERIDFTSLAQGFSFHYDGVLEAVNPDLRVVATGPDGIIYFVKHQQFPIYGIQSHPEATIKGIQTCLKKYYSPALELTDMPSEEVLGTAMSTFFHAFGITNIDI